MGKKLNNKLTKLKNFFHYNDFDAKKSVTSWFISPKSLLIIRGIICLYSWIVLIGKTVNYAMNYDAISYLTYFTHFSYIGLVAYFTLTAFCHSYGYVRKNKIPQHKLFNWLFWLLYHTLAHFTTIIILTYWIFFSDYFVKTNPQPYNWWLNISIHALNFLFAIVEVFLNRQIMVASFVILNLILEILYLGVVNIYYAEHSKWVYEFLDVTKGLKSFWWYLGLFIGFIVIYFIMYAVHMLRDYLGKNFGSKSPLINVGTVNINLNVRV